MVDTTTKKEDKKEKDVNVCENQKTFNKAFTKAIDNYPKEKYNQLTDGEKTSLTVQYILYVLLGLVFIVWAVFLAQKSKDKVMHTVLAFVFAPIYVFSYYISNK
jgi:hypothetical protein